jgi:hypothetical protein
MQEPSRLRRDGSFFDKYLLHRNKLFQFTSGHKLIFVVDETT